MMLDWNNIGDIVNQIKDEVKSKLGTDMSSITLEQVVDKTDKVFNAVGVLDEEQVKVYNEHKTIKIELDELVKVKEKFEKLVARYGTLHKYLTSSVELKYNLDGEVWRINEKTGMVEIFDTTLAKEQMKEMGIDEMLPPGMFDNDHE